METIWWNKIPNAAQFIQKISDNIKDGKSVILQLPSNTPWYECMKSIIEDELKKDNSYGDIKCLEESPDDPGKYLFHEYCKSEIRATYRPTKEYACFLAEHEEIALHNDIFWIHTESSKQLNSWISFVELYYKSISKGKQKCRFILETHIMDMFSDKKIIKVVSFNDSIEHYDNVLFNMLAASSVPGNETYKRYLAEVTSLLFPNDVEFSAKCISKGKSFLTNLTASINTISESDIRSNGLPFTFDLTPEELNERLWEAQIKILFPVIERYRNHIVNKYKEEIEAALPITTGYGDTITEAADVELGPITSLVASGKINMSNEDYTKVDKFKDARNSLAHFSVLPQQKVEFIIS